MSARRVVATGLGVIAPLGSDPATLWDRLEAGVSGVGPIRAFDAGGCPVTVAAEVPDLPATRAAKASRRSSRLAVAAVAAALADAGLAVDARGPAALYLATLPWELDHPETSWLDDAGEVDIAKADPLCLFRHIPTNAAYSVAQALGFRGPATGIASACAAGTVALGEAFHAVRRGDCDWAVAGGTCAPVTPIGVMGLTLIHALTTRGDASASCPFDGRRDGFVLGEGAGMLVLEEETRARGRGARIYGEVAGYGASMDGGRRLADPDPSGDGAWRAMAEALDSARASTDEVDCIKAHGTSTRANDRMESLAIRRLLGARAGEVPVTAPKSMLGHSLAAAGAVEAVAAFGILARGVIPPTINHTLPDPECDLDYVPNQARRKPVATILLNSFGMGGQNAALVLRRVSA